MQAPAHQGDEQVVVALTTISANADSDAFARTLVERRLIACANVIRDVGSTYRWDGKVVVEREQLVILKLSRSGVPALESALKEIHDYEVPELLVLGVSDGAAAYLSWVLDSVR
jgi:periplasmic divalent cation tolerance protein